MRPVRRTSLLLLVATGAIGLLVGASLPPLATRMGGSAPRLTWGSAVVLMAAAAAVGYLAWSTWQMIHKRRQTVHQDRGVFLLALAKASSRVGALFAGGYAGLAFAFVDAFDTELGRERVLRGSASALAAILLVVAALLLERACRLPGDDGDAADPGTESEPSPA